MRLRKQQTIDLLFSLINRTVKVMEELERQPRLDVYLNDKGGLMLIPRNEAGVVAVRIVHLWLGVEPPNVAFGDTVTIYKAPGQTQVHYPWGDDSDQGETSGDRRDIERTGSAVEEEGGEEERVIGPEDLISPSEYLSKRFQNRIGHYGEPD